MEEEVKIVCVCVLTIFSTPTCTSVVAYKKKNPNKNAPERFLVFVVPSRSVGTLFGHAFSRVLSGVFAFDATFALRLEGGVENVDGLGHGTSSRLGAVTPVLLVPTARVLVHFTCVRYVRVALRRRASWSRFDVHVVTRRGWLCLVSRIACFKVYRHAL